MFEVGFTELLLIFALALLVLGPQKLPKLAQQVGRWVGRARAMARQFRDQLEEEAHNFETKMTVDPGIDTSLEAKPGPATPATPTSPAPDHREPEDEFYPPDHHMHPANRAAVAAEAGRAAEAPAAPPAGTPAEATGDAGAASGRQGELALTSDSDADGPKAP